MIGGHRKDNIYAIIFPFITNPSIKCFMTREEEAWLWHRRLAHDNMRQIAKVTKGDLVKGLQKTCYKDKLYDLYQEGKQVNSTYR